MTSNVACKRDDMRCREREREKEKEREREKERGRENLRVKYVRDQDVSSAT